MRCVGQRSVRDSWRAGKFYRKAFPARPLQNTENPEAPLAARIAWAGGVGLDVATVYACSSLRHSQPVAEQVRECVEFAAYNRMYVPSELVSIDEGVGDRRDGLARLRTIVVGRHATVPLVSRISRLFRQSQKSHAFIENKVVRMGMRAIGVSDVIDTANTNVWQTLMMMNVVWRNGRRRRFYG